MTLYLGTSSARAELLCTMGWHSPVPLLDRDAAMAQARRHVLTDGGDPVLLRVRDGLEATAGIVPGVGDLVLAEVVPDATTAAERLGFPETAGLGDLVSGIMDALNETHATMRKVLDVGQGGNASLPDLHELRQGYDDLRGNVRNRLNRIHRAYKKGLRKLKRALAPTRKAQKAVHGRPASKKAPTARRATAPRGAASSPKKATRDVTVKGRLNGKPATTTVRKGSDYHLRKDRDGTYLVRRGQRGRFRLDPGDAGKLK